MLWGTNHIIIQITGVVNTNELPSCENENPAAASLSLSLLTFSGYNLNIKVNIIVLSLIKQFEM